MPIPEIVENVETALDVEALDASRVLVVGAAPDIAGLNSVGWDEFAAAPVNIADFSLVVLALETYDFLGGHDQVMVINAMNPRYPRFLEGPATELVLVGWNPHADRLISGLHMGVAFQRETGEFITDLDEEFGAYLRLVESFSWIMGLADEPGARRCRLLLRAAERDLLSISIRKDDQVRMVVLPSPTKCAIDEGIGVLLSEYYGLGGGPQPPPDWLAAVSLPEEDRLRERVSDLDAQLEPLLAEREKAESDLDLAREPLRVLYETGTNLEALVRNLLRDLGATVTEPENAETDDGTLETPSGYRVVVEIKARSTGPIRVVHARQLTDWVRTREYAEDDSEPEEWKGLLIGNPHYELPPNERPEEAFAPNCVRVADQDGHALVTTAQLIDALRDLQSGEFDSEAWWGTILASHGVASFG